MAVVKGMMKHLVDLERAAPGTVFDHEFISQHTLGYDDVIASIDATTWAS